MARTFAKILVANRGEIACRIMRTARAMGYRTVAVASEADADALHVREADEAVIIGPAPVANSYLDGARIIAAAKRTGADAIHPGYGFLSENAAFAAACADAGLVFIGPTVEAIQAMGDKAEAKRRMIAAGVPCVPGYESADQADAPLAAGAEAIGYPVMVKASAGGGGRGMRLVHRPADLAAALAAARSEAKNAFGNATLLLERAIDAPRHVEIQVFGDMHGQVVHLGERDCSIQRRHQKVIEEAPSPAVDSALRAAIGAAAIAAAKAIGYVGAGTVEFLLDASGAFYFLEMNTRLQVEHPVTECVTGLDLVALQFDVAQGKPLPFRQEDVRLDGHAIEARLYAEDPRNQFLPQTGRVLAWEPAAGAGIRVDHGLHAGTTVTPFYDPMLAKIIAHGRDREEARLRLARALADTLVLGITTNKTFLIEALETGDFRTGRATTAFIESNDLVSEPSPVPAHVIGLAAGLLADQSGAGWRSSKWGASPLRLVANGDLISAGVAREGETWSISIGREAQRLRILDRSADAVQFEVDGHVRRARYAQSDRHLFIDSDGRVFPFEDVILAPPLEKEGSADCVLRAPMNGLVIAIEVKPGDTIRRGDVVAVIEAMKMEHPILAPLDGRVESVAVGRGRQVAPRDVLATIVVGTAD